MSRWFRFYSEAMRNPKVLRLSDRDFRLWVNLLTVAAENDGRIPADDDLKLVLGMRLDHLKGGLNRLISGGLIDVLGDGYEPHNWSKFQYKSDTSTDRVQKHRAKRNVSETAPETEAEQKEESPLPPKGKAPLDYGQIQKRWNDLARQHGLPICEVMTDRRRAAIRARFNEYDLDAIHRAIDAVFVSPLCLGRKKDWRADFDFVFQAKSFDRLVQGSYSDDRPEQPVSPEQAERSRQTLDRLALARRRYPDLPAHKAVVKIIEEEQRQLARTAGRN